jgi:glycosyltransferase involved in cell wall biosynthesis
LNIAVNTRLLLPNKLEGIGWFTYEVLKRITQNHPEHTFFLFFDRPFDQEFVFSDNCKPIVIYPQARHPILYKIWFDFSIPRALKKYKIDIFLSPDGFLSTKTDVPQISVMHDLNFEHLPDGLPQRALNYYKKYFPIFAQKAQNIITVSEFSKQDISNTYQVPSEKITVAYNGVSDIFKPISESESTSIKDKYTESNDYLVYVGALHKRKNIVKMLQAFDLYKKQYPSSLKFVIVGEKLFKSQEIDGVYESLSCKNDIIFTGRLAQQTLTKVVAGSKAMIYVSIFEGFGIPVVESMKCGVPVLTSNVTSLPEVGGEYAVYCDPLNVESISNGILEVLNHSFDTKELIAHSSKFNWDTTADIVWEVIQKTMDTQ